MSSAGDKRQSRASSRPPRSELPVGVSKELIREEMRAMPASMLEGGAGGEGPWKLSENFSLSLRQAISVWMEVDAEFRGKV